MAIPFLHVSALFMSVTAAWTFGQGLLEQAQLLPFIPSHNPIRSDSRLSPSSKHEFTLRHVLDHGLYFDPDFRQRIDVDPPETESKLSRRDSYGQDDSLGPFTVQSLPSKIYRLLDRKISDIEPLLSAARFYGEPPELPESAWALDDLPAPNATDRETVLNFALMAANAYNEDKSDPEWEDSHAPFNHSSKYGWRRDTLRGHVYADKDNSTIVLAIKGTSPAVFDGAATTTNDKINDNLFFGCCCGQGGQYLWLKVCDCMSSAYTCNKTCLVKALKEKNRYYHAALELYGNVTELYPDSNVWLAGHSLGGSVSSLLGLTFGLPTITFEAPGEALPAARLGLPIPPGNTPGAHQRRQYTGAYHFGHTADPIFMGTCNAATSACTLGFYAMESQCHTGHRCVWDTVGDKKWRVSATTHSIRSVIKDVIRGYDTLPQCERDTECQDCALWKFYESNRTESTSSSTTSTSTTSPTRTATCKTPGWWGCNDPTTTTTTAQLTTSTTIITTETCTAYGWFGGCIGSTITTTITSATTLPVTPTPTSSISPTCSHPGYFWGCRDPSSSPTSTIMESVSPSTSCLTPGHLWGCYDETSSAEPHEVTQAPHLSL